MNGPDTRPGEPVDYERLDRDEMKDAVKEAIKEWLNERAADFGKWSLRWIGMAIFAGAVYLFLLSHGWRPPQ